MLLPDSEGLDPNVLHKISELKKNVFIEGLVHPKMNILSVITHPHVVPTSKTFAHLWNTN